MKVKTTYTILVLLLVTLGAFHWFIKDGPDERGIWNTIVSQDSGEWTGKTAPDFKLKLLDGSKFDLAAAKGKQVVVLNFFSTWCGPCQAEVPELNRFYSGFKGNKKLVFVGISNEAESQVKGFVETRKVGYPIGIDKEEKLGEMYGVRAYPTTVVIGADGRIALYEVGAISNADVSLKKVVLKSLKALHGDKGAGGSAAVKPGKGAADD